MAPKNFSSEKVREALTFDDVLLVPGASEILPDTADIGTRLTKSIKLSIPLLSSAMDTVTEAEMAIALAQHGGLGIIHRNMTPEAQAEAVRRVKRYESGMVVNPITIGPDAVLAEALEMMAHYNISGIPVTEQNNGRLVGILTNRDVRFADNPRQPVRELMTADHLIKVYNTVDKEEAKKLLHKHRIEKLLVVDDQERCVGLMTVKDIEKAKAFPNACKDTQDRLRAGAAIGTGDTNIERADALVDAEVDVIVVDTAHGHSKGVIEMVHLIKKKHGDTVQILSLIHI